MQQLISHKHSIIVDQIYLQKVFNSTKLKVDYEKLRKTLSPQHEIAVFLSPFERDTSFAAKLMTMDNIHITDLSSPLETFGEVLMYLHATRAAPVNDLSYFEIIADPSVVEKYADLYGALTPNWIFRVWSLDVSHVTNRRNVVCKNLHDLDIFQEH